MLTDTVKEELPGQVGIILQTIVVELTIFHSIILFGIGLIIGFHSLLK